jgi:hypothetical protein
MPMKRTLDDVFPLVIIRNAIRVTPDALNAISAHAQGNKTYQPTVIPVFSTEDYIVSWVECYNDYETDNVQKVYAILVVTDIEGYIVDDNAVEKAAKLAAMDYRVTQIHHEYGIKGEVNDTKLISRILERVWAGEWMGQFNDGTAIYFQELAALLNRPMGDMWALVDDLTAQRLVDVLPSSWILVAPKGDTPRKGTEEAYGHLEYSCSDFGYWSCASCGQNGDDYSNASDCPCV